MKTVESKAHVGGELGVRGFVAEIVADVGEPSVVWLEFTDESERLVDGGMHGMGRVTKRVEDEMVQAAQQSFGGFRHGAEIGEVGHGADAEALNGERAMLGGDGNDVRAEEFKGSVERMEFDLGKGTFAGLRFENISEGAAENCESFFRGINGNRGSLFLVEWSNVVEAQDVVGVGVGIQDGVETADILA